VLNIVDLIILGILLIFIYGNYRKGFTNAVFSFIAIVAAIYGAFRLYPDVAVYLRKYIDSPDMAAILSFALLFLAISLAVNYISKLLGKSIDSMSLGWLNSALGGAIGFAKGFVLVGVVVYVLSSLNYPVGKRQFSESRFTPYVTQYFTKVVRIALNVLPEDIKQKGERYGQELNELRK